MTTDTTRRESLLARIRALMAKTTANGCTEAEAAEAARKVDELIARYEIDLDELTMRKQEIVMVRVKAGEHDVRFSCGAIGTFTDCRVWLHDKKEIIYLGFQVDTEVAEYLTLLFQRAIDREHATFILFNRDFNDGSPTERRDLKQSFGLGMARRLGERLRDLKSKRDFTARSTGRDLVMMKKPVVDEAFAKLGIIFGHGGRAPTARDHKAFNAGRDAAGRVAINHGVAERASRQAGRLS